MKLATVHFHRPCWCHLTQHAVDQFISRWEPNKNRQEAEDELFSLLSTSKKVGSAAYGGDIYVSGHRSNIRMLVKDRNVCVTILPPPDTINQDEAEFLKEQEQDLLDLYAARQAPLLAELELLKQEKAELDRQKTAIKLEFERQKREALQEFVPKDNDISKRMNRVIQQLAKPYD